jgi:hypothetical protein
MAHEFGHLVARATPDFLDYQSQQSRRSHLDEFFADIFATYTFGPAFACTVILLQFNPAEAYTKRGAHPRHEERVRLILQTLREMNKKAQSGERYEWLIEHLGDVWDESVTLCQAAPDDKADFDQQIDESKRWGRNLYRLIDTYYGLGASYRPEQWAGAQRIAYRLKMPLTTWQDLVAKVGLEQVLLADVSNAIWCSRLTEPPANLTTAAHQLARLYIGE